MARISITGVPDEPGQLAKVFTALAVSQIDVDIIVQSGGMNGSADFAFTVGLSDLDKAVATIWKFTRSNWIP